jgi:type I restriction enzyme, S subunit
VRYRLYPNYKVSGVEWLGDIPEHWGITKSKWLFKKMQRPIRDTDGIVTAFRDGIVTLRINRRAGGFTNAMLEHGYQGIRKGDLVIHAMDAFAGAIGVSDSEGKSTPVYSVCIPRESDKVITSYYGKLLRVMSQRQYIHALSKGVRERSTEFRYSEFSVINLPVPPLKEQQAIANYLDMATFKIDSLIAKQEKLKELLKEKRQATVDAIIHEQSTIYKRMGWVTNRVYRPVSRIADKQYIALGLYNRGRGLFHKLPKEGSELGDSDFYWTQEGDLILSGQFAWEGSVAIASHNENDCIVSHRYPVVKGVDGVIKTQYLWAYLTTRDGDFLLNEHSVGSAGRNRPLNINTLMKAVIPVPTIEAQMRVTKIVITEEKIKVIIDKAIDLLKEKRTALISSVVTGKLDVREAV